MGITVFKSSKKMQHHLSSFRKKGLEVGFVPTMGALHAGHQSLVTVAKKQSDIVVASVFVNPTQFNDAGDLDGYPKTLGLDIEKLIDVGCDVLYAPEVSDVYPHGVEPTEQYDLGYLDNVLEGEFRPGHFQGVAQVVERLLSLVNPNKLFMGQKDYQQCAVIRRLLTLMKSDTILVPCPIIREPDGLAMSSRNARLNAAERKVSIEIHKSLEILGMDKDLRRLPNNITRQIARLNSFELLKVEYLRVCNAETLLPVEDYTTEPLVICAAVWCGEVRLIDNTLL